MDELAIAEFIVECEEVFERMFKPAILTGWETVIFEVEDLRE